MEFITPVEITPGTANAWTDADVSAHIPAGATGGYIELQTGGDYGLRKNGSSENIYEHTDRHSWAIVECDANMLIEAKSTTVFYLVGYPETGGAVTNKSKRLLRGIGI